MMFIFLLILIIKILDLFNEHTLINAAPKSTCVGDFQLVGQICGDITSTTRRCCLGGLECSESTKKCVVPISVMFIGNSFTIRNTLPSIFRRLAIASNDMDDTDEVPSVIIGSSLFPAASLNFHVNRDETWRTLYSRGSWTAVVLQEQSQFLSYDDSWTETRVYPHALELSKAIGSLSAKTILFETWGYQWGDSTPEVTDDYYKMQKRINEGAKFLEQKLESNIDVLDGFDVIDTDGVKISPVGDAWTLAYSDLSATGSENLLYNIDGKHPSIRGTYLAACTLYATIFNKSPIGLNYWPSGMSKKTARDFQRYAAIATGFAKSK